MSKGADQTLWIECEFDNLVSCRDGHIYSAGVASRGAPAGQRGVRVHRGRLAARRGAAGLPSARGSAPVPDRPGHDGQVSLEGLRRGRAGGIPHGQDRARERAAAARGRHRPGRVPQGGRPARRDRPRRGPGGACAARRGLHAEDEPAAEGRGTDRRRAEGQAQDGGTQEGGAGTGRRKVRRGQGGGAGTGRGKVRRGQGGGAGVAEGKSAGTKAEKAGGAERGRPGARRNSADRGRNDLART